VNLMKKCKVCQQEKEIKNDFSVQKSRGKEYSNNICKECVKEKQKKYRIDNKQLIKQRNKDYYNIVKDTNEFIDNSKKYRDSRKKDKSDYDREYRKVNQEKIKRYYRDNQKRISETRRQYHLNHQLERKDYNRNWYLLNKKLKHSLNKKYMVKRLRNDSLFRLRYSISKSIRKYLKLNNSGKNGNSILKFLPYTIQELKEHLEKQFESWMSWNNWGSYRVDIWKDDNQSTWTWQIDHIVPQSKLPYTSMEDKNFKKCWALDNLRPLNSKMNLLESNNR